MGDGGSRDGHKAGGGVLDLWGKAFLRSLGSVKIAGSLSCVECICRMKNEGLCS